MEYLQVNDKILVQVENGFLIGQYKGKSTHGGVLIIKIGMYMHNAKRISDSDLTETQLATVHFFEREYDVKPLLVEL